jgi:hypothetical protein
MAQQQDRSHTGEETTGQVRLTGQGWLPRWEVIALAAGDSIAVLVFAVIGRASHDLLATDGPILATLNTAVPFAAAWIVVGLITGFYNGRALFPAGRVVWQTLLTGLFAGPLGVVLRAAWLKRPVIWVFLLVATAASTMVVLVWRLGWSFIRRLWWPELSGARGRHTDSDAA